MKYVVILVLLCGMAYGNSIVDPGMVFQSNGSAVVTLSADSNPLLTPTIPHWMVFGFPVWSTDNIEWSAVMGLGDTLYYAGGLLKTAYNGDGMQMVMFSIWLPSNYSIQQGFIHFVANDEASLAYNFRKVTPVPEIPTGVMALFGTLLVGCARRFKRV